MIKQKGFTLIELLVVVAIIGILAAVGVVAYSGYTKSAKIQAVKQQHKQVVKYLQSELTKCDIGGELHIHSIGGGFKYYIPWVTCARRGDGTVYQKTLFDNMTSYFAFGNNWKNPFGTQACSSFCNNLDDAFEYFGGAPSTKQIGKMHCWWTGGGRGGGTGHCVSRFGTGASDIIETKFDANGY